MLEHESDYYDQEFGNDIVKQELTDNWKRYYLVEQNIRENHKKTEATGEGDVSRLIDYIWVRDLRAPIHLGLINGPFVPRIKIKGAL